MGMEIHGGSTWTAYAYVCHVHCICEITRRLTVELNEPKINRREPCLEPSAFTHTLRLGYAAHGLSLDTMPALAT